MKLNNEKGSVIIASALIMAVLAGVIYFYSNVQMLKVTKEYRRTKSMAYAHQISAGLAQQLRWSYDIAMIAIEDPADPVKQGLCASYGGVPTTIGPVPLCLINEQVCTVHPANLANTICVKRSAIPSENTLFAKTTPANDPGRIFPEVQARDPVLVRLLWGSHVAYAQGYRPAPPAAIETANSLPDWPKCLTGACNVKCGQNADCISYTFCPIKAEKSFCDPEEFVTQTVAFLKD